MIIGLRFGYGVNALMLVQPVTASIMPPLAYLTFRALSSNPVIKPWPHILPPLLLAAGVAFAPWFVDPLLLSIFLCYGVAIWRLTVEGDITEAALQKTTATIRAAHVTALLLAFFSLTDGLLSVFTFFYGNAYVPMAVTGMNIGAIIIVGAYYLWPEQEASPVVAATGRSNPIAPEDEAALARIAEALENGQLYAQENLSLARLARKAGMPARDVSAVINRITGLNVSQYVNNRRIEEACRLLEQTEKSVTALMLEAGFFYQVEFQPRIPPRHRTSPAQWRSNARKKVAGNIFETKWVKKAISAPSFKLEETSPKHPCRIVRV